MAVAIQTSAFSTSAPSGSTITKALTVTGANELLFVVVMDSGRTCTGVTYNGVSLTPIVTYNDGYTYWLGYLANPSTGTNNIVATMSGTGTVGGISAVSMSGVKQTSPVNTYATDGHLNDNTDRGAEITTTVDGCGVFTVGVQDNGSFSAGDANSTLVGTQWFYALGRAGIVRSATFPQASAGAIKPVFDGASGSWGRAITIAFEPAGASTGFAYSQAVIIA